MHCKLILFSVNVFAEHRMKCQTFLKKNKKYMKLIEYKLSFNPEKVYMDITGLFPNNEEFSKQLANTFSENTDIIFQELKGPFAEVFSSIQMTMFNKVYAKFPINEIYLE